MVRRAALASMVEPSTPMLSPLTKPFPAISFRTQPNTSSCTFKRDAAAGLRQPGMIGNPVVGAEAKKLAQRKTVTAAPFDAPLAVDPLEIAHKVHAKIASRRD